MNIENKIKIFLVDDDAVFLKSLELEFIQKENFLVQTFSSGEICIENLNQNPDVVILDYQLDGINKGAMNGLDTLDKIKKFNPEIPVIMLSGQDKIEVAVNCMHHLAYDYVVKSETAFLRLHKIIPHIFHFKKIERQLNWYIENI
jgi:two-component system, OmpR family, response regulator